MVRLINQNDYKNVIYVTKTKKPDFKSGLQTTIETSGCGICCGMMVSQFYGFNMSMDDAIQLSYDYNANTGYGTKYIPYATGLCDKFNLSCSVGYDAETLFKHLDSGNCAVANVGGDHDEHIGLFSHGGHYIFIYKHVGDDVYILDPGIEPNKYLEDSRKGRVKFEGEFVIGNVNDLLKDTENRDMPFFMFSQRKDNVTYQNVFNRIDELKDKFVNIWKYVVEIESPTVFKEGVDNVGKYFVKYAQGQVWNYETQINDVAGNALCITMNEKANKQPIAISGHMDTVHPVGSMPTYIKDGKIYGPGCTDCKGGLIVCLLAMQALKDCGYTERPIKFILQADEEVGSRYSKHKTIDFMCEKASDCIAFLNTEMMEPGTAVLERKGISRYKMTFKGVAAHSSVCEIGKSSILEASYKIIDLEKMKQADGITINVGTIEGGTTPNTVPAECSIQIDVRFNDEKQRLEADNYIKEIAAKTYVEGVTTELEYLSFRIAMDLKQNNIELLNNINKVFESCGLSQLKARKAKGGSDAAYTSAAGIPSIDSIGVTGGYIHSKDEYGNIDSLTENAKRMAALIIGL